jgi:hypothetical protein
MDQGWFVANLWFALALVAVGKDRFPIRPLRTLALAAQFFAKMVSNVASLLPRCAPSLISESWFGEPVGDWGV